MKDKILIAGLLSLLGLMSIYLFVNYFLFYMAVIILIAIFFYIVSHTNRYRKENLNIIKDNNKLYFYLSDDLLCKVNVSENRKFSDTLRYSISNELHSLKNIISKVNFINFKNDLLLNEMNAKL